MEVAKQKFGEGVRLFQNGDIEGARRSFLDAEREHHAAPIVYNLGLAEERLGHPQAAVDAYERYLAEEGDRGELSAPAAVAIAQIKARSTKLRIRTKPPGARLFVDGAPLPDLSPTTVLVTAGHHVVVAQGETFRAESELEAEGRGDLREVSLDAPAAAAPAEAPVPPSPAPPPPAPAPAEPSLVVWHAAFVVSPIYMLGADNVGQKNSRNGTSVVAGAGGSIGLGISDELAFVLRGFAGIGPDAKPATAYAGGPGVIAALGRVRFGATFLGGRLDTRANDADYSTDLVFGSGAEVGFVVVPRKHARGGWVAAFEPWFLLTNQKQDNTSIFFAASFGYRSF